MAGKITPLIIVPIFLGVLIIALTAFIILNISRPAKVVQEPPATEKQPLKQATDPPVRTTPDPWRSYPQSLLKAAQSDDAGTIRYISARGGDVDYLEPETNLRAVNYAARNNALEALEALVDEGAALNFPQPQYDKWASDVEIGFIIKKQSGYSPLIDAVIGNNLEMIRFLLKRGASPDTQDLWQIRVLLIAMMEGHEEVALELLKQGASTDLVSHITVWDFDHPYYYKDKLSHPVYDESALHLAYQFECIQVADYLIARGMDIFLGKNSVYNMLIFEEYFGQLKKQMWSHYVRGSLNEEIIHQGMERAVYLGLWQQAGFLMNFGFDGSGFMQRELYLNYRQPLSPLEAAVDREKQNYRNEKSEDYRKTITLLFQSGVGMDEVIKLYNYSWNRTAMRKLIEAAQLAPEISEIHFSGYLEEPLNLNAYHPVKAFDGNIHSAWLEGREDAGPDSFIGFTLAEEVTVDEIYVLPSWGDADHYTTNNRVKQLEMQLGEYKTILNFKDELGYSKISLPSEITFRECRFTIRQIYASDKWNDTPIAEIRFFHREQELIFRKSAYLSYFRQKREEK